MTATSIKTDEIADVARRVSVSVSDILYETAKVEVLPRFQALAAHEIIEKRPGDLVTAADHAAERALEAALPDLIPGSVVLGEEGYEANPSILDVLAADKPVWIVDPVDGTHNFAHGIKPFTMIVALVQSGHVVGGWIIDPIAEETLWAVDGRGAFLNSADGESRRLMAPDVPFERAVMAAGEKLRRRILRATSTGLPRFQDRYRCVGREYMDIALGRLQLARYGGRLKPWDHAAGCLIVREAGGVANWVDDNSPYTVTDAIPTRSLGISASPELWPQLRQLMQRTDASR